MNGDKQLTMEVNLLKFETYQIAFAVDLKESCRRNSWTE